MSALCRSGTLTLAIAIAGCAAPSPRAQEPEASLSRFEAPPSTAGAERCIDCHRDMVESWSRTGMARSVSPFDPAELRGLAPVADEPAGYVYRFESDARGSRIVETRPPVPEHELDAEIAYAIGADDIRSYVALQGSFEFFAPLEIVAETAKAERHAALAPGHMAAPNQRFSVPITPECLGCHTDRLPPAAFPLHLHQAGAWEPRGISCAACHGAVDQHVEWQRVDLAGKSQPAPDPIVRPRQLTREERMSICSACHLQGDVRISLDGRFGPPPPGGDLLDRLAVFVSARPTQDIGFVSHTERLVQSRCYQESGTMWCGSCHDPHRLLRADERARVRSACLDCHGPEEHATAPHCGRPEPDAAADPDCASCHMRRTPVYDVAHVEIHDHFIRKQPGAPSAPSRPRTESSPTGDWKVFGWPNRPAPEYAEDPGLWMMAYDFRGHHERALAKALEEPGPRTREFAMYHHVRGLLLERFGRADQALRSYQWALMLDPDLASSAINLALLRGVNGDPDRGIELLDRVLARHPAAVNALRNRAGLRLRKHDAEGFVADLRRAFELAPDAVVADVLAEWYRDQGDAGTADEWARRAARLDPVQFPE